LNSDTPLPSDIPAPEEQGDQVIEVEMSADQATPKSGLLGSGYLRAGIGGVILMTAGFSVTFTGAFGLLGGAKAESGIAVIEPGNDPDRDETPAQTFEQMPHERLHPEEVASVAPAPITDHFGEISRRDTLVFYRTTSLAVTLPSETGPRVITLSVGLRTNEASAELLMNRGDTIKRLLTNSVQAVEYDKHPQWALPGLICANLESRLIAEYPDARIKDVLLHTFAVS